MVTIAIDTETLGLDARKFVLGVAIQEKDTNGKPGKPKVFYKRDDMYNWITQTIEENWKKYRHKTYVYAHNHRFDFHVYANKRMIEDMNHYNFLKDIPFLATYKKVGYLTDTLHFYGRQTLQQIGEQIGYKKAETPEELLDTKGKITPELLWKATPYCIRDTEIVLKAITKLKKDLEMIGYKPRKLLTAGQMSMNIFMNFANKNNLQWTFAYNQNIKRGNEDKKIIRTIKCRSNQLIKQAHKGGRVQAFQTGKWKQCTMIDVNSLYPYAMTRMKFPLLHTETEKQEITEHDLSKPGIIKCVIQTPDKIDIAYLPIRTQYGTAYPKNATMKGTWTLQEIKRAIKEGYELLKVEKAITFREAEINPLKEFSTKLYKLREFSNKPIKLILNNLHGKFAQHRPNKLYRKVHRKDVDELIRQGWEIKMPWNEDYIMRKEGEIIEPRYYAPIISTEVTATARNIMQTQLKKIPIKDLIYTDTDSIIFKGKHIEKYNINNKLGGWKIKEEKQPCKVLGKKTYYIGEQLKASGASKRVLTKQNLEEEKAIEVEKMITLREAIGKGIMLNNIGKFRKLTHRIETKEPTEYKGFLTEVEKTW